MGVKGPWAWMHQGFWGCWCLGKFWAFGISRVCGKLKAGLVVDLGTASVPREGALSQSTRSESAMKAQRVEWIVRIAHLPRALGIVFVCHWPLPVRTAPGHTESECRNLKPSGVCRDLPGP